MPRTLRRKLYRRVRFKTWFRKANYYWRRHKDIYRIMARFRTAEQLQDRRYVRLLKKDMIKSLLKYGAYFDEYFLFGYEGRDDEYRSSFITEGIRLSFYPRMNTARGTSFLEDKYATYKKFKDFYKREMMCLRAHAPMTDEERAAFAEFVAGHDRFVVKPTFAAFGKGFRIVSAGDFPSVDEAYEELHAEGVVLEELIVQDERMAALHPQSVNTLRVPTALIRDGHCGKSVALFNPTLRVGQGGSIVDNTSAGGLSCLIDPDTGVLTTDAADKLGRRCYAHPDTGVVFRGFQIPEWDQVKRIVTEAALMMPDDHYIGWDLALCAGKGWCMVEANSNAQMSGMQFVPQKGRRQELEALIEKM